MRLIDAADSAAIGVTSTSDDTAWARKARRDDLIGYCETTQQRPEFLFPERDRAFVIFVREGERMTTNRMNKISSAGGSGENWSVEFTQPIPRDRQVFYQSEAYDGSGRLIDSSDTSAAIKRDEMPDIIKVTFD